MCIDTRVYLEKRFRVNSGKAVNFPIYSLKPGALGLREGAQGIERYPFLPEAKKIQAESPVFCGFAAKNAP
jgi:hypothetical protein